MRRRLQPVAPAPASAPARQVACSGIRRGHAGAGGLDDVPIDPKAGRAPSKTTGGTVLAIEKDLVKRNWQGSNDQYAQLIVAEARAAVSWEPQNVEYRCWLNIYR